MPKVISEFKDFIARGNVVDLAIAVVIGAAFGKIITALVDGIIMPIVGTAMGEDFTGMTFTINNSTFSYGLVINAVIYFLVVAAAIFFLVIKPLNVLNERLRPAREA